MMTALTRKGLIAATGRHSITLRRLAALRQAAGSDEEDFESRDPAPPRRAVWPH